MPKMKTKRSAAKRFKLTATGKVKFQKAFKRHILSKKSTTSKRKKRLAGYVHNANMMLTLGTLPYRRKHN
ncbi:MAG: 50S ribosomal protein L35 [Bacteriovoracaceae bacterium]